MVNKIVKSVKKPVIILEANTHICIVWCIGLVLVFLGVYTISTPISTDFFVCILLCTLGILKLASLYYKKRLILTDKKIYLMLRDKKVFSWLLEQDFYMVNYSQNQLGKLLGFGSLSLVNREKDMYQYYFLNNPQQVYEAIINAYEARMSQLDPTFVKEYSENKKSLKKQTDQLDKIESS